MAARASLASLITRVRTLIDDNATTKTFTDDEVQAALDNWRTDVRYLELRPAETRTSSGVEYRDYYAPCGDWEADAVLYDSGYATLTPTTSEYQAGHWAFTTGVTPPVYIVGKTFDVYAAAADLLEMWAAREKLSFDFDTDGQSFKRSQKAAALLALAREYRRQQRPASVLMDRGDIRSWYADYQRD